MTQHVVIDGPISDPNMDLRTIFKCDIIAYLLWVLYDPT